MVDVALNSYEISSETFKAALAYAKTFNSTFTYDMIGVVDIGIASGLIAETIATGGVSRIRTIEDAQKIADKDKAYAKSLVKHTFEGDKAGGWHYEGLNSSNSKIIEVTKRATNGVYEATVDINGKIKPSTFFPKKWTPEQIFKAIKDVYENVYPNGTYNVYKNTIEGWFGGVKIRLNLDTAGKIISAFPIIE